MLLDVDRLARIQPRPSRLTPPLVETLVPPDQSGPAGTQEAEESQEVSEAIEEESVSIKAVPEIVAEDRCPNST